MNNEQNQHALISDYLDGKLDKMAIQKFEALLTVDHDLREALSLEKVARQVITTAGRSNLRDKFNRWEQEIETPVRRINPLRAIVIAATVLALIAASIWIFFNDSPTSSDQLFTEHFEIYRNPIFTRSSEAGIESQWEYAIKFYAEGDFEKAATAFEASLHEESAIQYLAYFYLGVSYLSQPKPQPKKAIMALDQVLNSDNDYHQQALWYKALAYLKMGEAKNAEKVLQELSKKGNYKKKEVQEILEIIKN